MPPLPDERCGLPAKVEQIMSNVTIHGGLTIATVLYDLVNDEILVGTNITPADFWNGFDQAAHQLAPKNQALLETRATSRSRLKKSACVYIALLWRPHHACKRHAPDGLAR